MRRFFVVATALAAVLGVTAVAIAATTGTTSTKFKAIQTGTSGTVKAPKPIGITFNATVSQSDGSQPPQITTLTFLFDKHTVINSSKFPICTSAQLNATKDPTKCKKGSKLGSGITQANLDRTPLPFAVTAFNGAGGKMVLFVSNPTFGIKRAFDATYGKGPAGYGKKLVVAIPSDLQQPAPGTRPSIVKLNFGINARIRKAGKTYGYFSSTGCTRHKANYGVILKFRGAPSKTLKSVPTTACR